MSIRKKVGLGAVAVVLILMGMCVMAAGRIENAYQASLTPERRAQIDTLAQEMGGLQSGDLVEFANGDLKMVMANTSPGSIHLEFWNQGLSDGSSLIETVVRNVVAIHRIDDPGYLDKFKKHLGRLTIDSSNQSHATVAETLGEVGFHNIMSSPIGEMRLVTLTLRSGEIRNWAIHAEHIPRFLDNIEQVHNTEELRGSPTEIVEVILQSPARSDASMWWDIPILSGGEVEVLWAIPGTS